MQFKAVKTLWGVKDSHLKEQWESLFTTIAAEGYAAIESISLTWQTDPSFFVTCLKRHNLGLIIQIHTTGGYIYNDEYIYCSSCRVPDHVESFRSQLTNALEMGAFMVNCHSGHDSWDLEEASTYFRQVLLIERELLIGPYQHVVVVHETHRQRLLHSPYQAKLILSQAEFASLKINADISHWVCVCEHLFDERNPRDSWWPTVLDLVAKHCHFIHARFGHAEGPQVYDPREEIKWKEEIARHIDWWKVIWKSQHARGLQVTFVEPEHGM